MQRCTISKVMVLEEWQRFEKVFDYCKRVSCVCVRAVLRACLCVFVYVCARVSVCYVYACVCACVLCFFAVLFVFCGALTWRWCCCYDRCRCCCCCCCCCYHCCCRCWCYHRCCRCCYPQGLGAGNATNLAEVEGKIPKKLKKKRMIEVACRGVT